jgi:hypothetical protein
MDLAQEIEKAKDRSEAQLAEQVNAVVPATELDVATIALINPFIEFCAAVGVRHAPAKPTTVAGYILHHASIGTPEDRTLAFVAAIERLHDHYGLANPVATPAARFALEQVVKDEAPRSWTKPEKLLWATLPPKIRAVIAKREHARETHLRRSQNVLAEQRRQLKTAAEPKPVDETEKEIDMATKKDPGVGPYAGNDVKLTRVPVAPYSPGRQIDRDVTENAERNGGFGAPVKPVGE